MAELLKKLSETNGVSGNENNIRDIVKEELKNITDNITVDSMGNVIAFKQGNRNDKTILVTVNIDEAGFIISKITDEGYLKFKTVGDIDARKLVSKKVIIGKERLRGVIGMKAIHLQTKSERENVVDADKLFIDIGAKNKAEAEKYISLGDYGSFETEYKELWGNVKGKALDRSGVCYSLIQALKNNHKNSFYACFLSQKEVGSRGAKIAAHRLNADAVLSLSTADTTDMFGCEDKNSGGRLGDGIILNYADKTVIADKKLADSMAKKAEERNIKFQKKALMPNSSDSGAFQTGAVGARCINAVIPCRYSHSPVSVMSLDDIDSAIQFIDLFLDEIGEMI